MVYKDKTWCKFEDCKVSKSCHRALTEKDKCRIIEEKYLVSYFAEKPECYK